MKLIPHHQDDKAGRREYRSPDGTWRVVPGPAAAAATNGRAGRCTSATRTTPAGIAAPPSSADEMHWSSWTPRPRHRGARARPSRQWPPKQRETPERSAEPPPPSPRRTPRRPITHYIDETRSEDIRWSLCGVFLYDEKQIAKGDEPATCGKCQRYTTATSYLKRQEAKKTAKKTGRAVARASNDRD